MSKYETYLAEIEDGELSLDAMEAAADSLAFVASLHTVFRDNGYDLLEEPNVSDLENILDNMMGELAAASLFLSEDSFKNVPQMLRLIADELKKDGGEVVPGVIVNGYHNLANRIEATRVQMQQMKDLVSATQTK